MGVWIVLSIPCSINDNLLVGSTAFIVLCVG